MFCISAVLRKKNYIYILRKRDNVLHNHGIIKILINMYHITMKFKDAIASCDASQTDLHGLVQVSIEIQQSGVA